MSVKMRKCPRWGWVELSTDLRTYVVETLCKTWSCVVCRDKLKSLIKMRMEYGCLILGKSYLITLTLKEGGDSILKDANYVRKAWTALLRRLKKRSPNLTWFRVIETTKKGIPHLHLIVGGLTSMRKDSCITDKNRRPYSLKWIRSLCRTECLVHEWGSAWSEVTDSFVVDAKEIYNVPGAARYLAKYLSKGFDERQRLIDLGFERRWSCARNWPREEKVQLRGTREGAWTKVAMVERSHRRSYMERRAKMSQGDRLCESVGDKLGLSLRKEARKKSGEFRIEKLKKVVSGSDGESRVG